jgi:hypothetical protein
VVIVWFALFLLITLCFISIGIDIAKLAATRTQLQNAADAAALAAASAVNPVSGVIDQDRATAKAVDMAASNKAFINDSQPVILDPADVQYLASDLVKVTVRRTGDNSVVTHFAQVLGIKSLEMNASATAKAAPLKCPHCIVPFGVALNPAETLTPGCGNLYTLKRGSGTGSRGNYGYLALPDCSETPCAPGQPLTQPSRLACIIGHGYCCNVCSGDQVNVATGQKEPAIDGSVARWAADIDQRNGICYSQYAGNGSRVITVPLIDAYPPGTSGTANVIGFATFFLQLPPEGNQGNITAAEFIYYSTAGTPGGQVQNGGVTYVPMLVQ